MKPICVKCRCFYRCKQNGVPFIEGMPISNGFDAPTPRGNAAPEQWEPYKLWWGDLWECPDCSHQTIAGVAPQPFSEHYEPEFKDYINQFKPQIQINDC